jgi:hypothetical protein
MRRGESEIFYCPHCHTATYYGLASRPVLCPSCGRAPDKASGEGESPWWAIVVAVLATIGLYFLVRGCAK